MIKNNKENLGKLIVIYGSNNLGKSIQTRLLSTRLLEEKSDILVIKYPVYNLKPTGPKINEILRNPKSKDRDIKEINFQKIYIQNRFDFQPTVKNLLSAGINIIAEDYIGTGVAWGVTNSIIKEHRPKHEKDILIDNFLKLNSGLINPDLSILLDGKRFKKSIEKDHKFEDRGDNVWNLNREIHLALAKKLNWIIVKANQSIDKVHTDIWEIVKQKFNY